MSYALMFQLLSCNNCEYITVNIQIDDLVLSEYSSVIKPQMSSTLSIITYKKQQIMIILWKQLLIF